MKLNELNALGENHRLITAKTGHQNLVLFGQYITIIYDVAFLQKVLTAFTKLSLKHPCQSKFTASNEFDFL